MLGQRLGCHQGGGNPRKGGGQDHQSKGYLVRGVASVHAFSLSCLFKSPKLRTEAALRRMTLNQMSVNYSYDEGLWVSDDIRRKAGVFWEEQGRRAGKWQRGVRKTSSHFQPRSLRAVGEKSPCPAGSSILRRTYFSLEQERERTAQRRAWGHRGCLLVISMNSRVHSRWFGELGSSGI